MDYNELPPNEREKLMQFAMDYLRDYAYKNGKSVYDFMDANKIGKSAYGAFMDAAGRDKGVIAHRLFGHHLIYDFPIDDLNNVAPFLEHLFSDLFTKQGLPIIPGEVLRDAGLLKCCDSLTRSWNFVNGFDILSGTVAIYSGVLDFKSTFIDELSIDSFEDFAKTAGVGALEMAIAFTTANPFLLVGGILSLTAGLKGLMNSSARVYFRKIHYGLSIEFAMDTLNVDAFIKKYRVEENINGLTVQNNIASLSFDNNINSLGL